MRSKMAMASPMAMATPMAWAMAWTTVETLRWAAPGQRCACKAAVVCRRAKKVHLQPGDSA